MFFEAYKGLIQGFYDGSVGASIRVLQGFGRRIFWFRVVLSKSCSESSKSRHLSIRMLSVFGWPFPGQKGNRHSGPRQNARFEGHVV